MMEGIFESEVTLLCYLTEGTEGWKSGLHV